VLSAVPEVYQKVRHVFVVLFVPLLFPFLEARLPIALFSLQIKPFWRKGLATTDRFRENRFAKSLGSKVGLHIAANRATGYPLPRRRFLCFGSLCQKPVHFGNLAARPKPFPLLPVPVIGKRRSKLFGR